MTTLADHIPTCAMRIPFGALPVRAPRAAAPAHLALPVAEVHRNDQLLEDEARHVLGQLATRSLGANSSSAGMEAGPLPCAQQEVCHVATLGYTPQLGLRSRQVWPFHPQTHAPTHDAVDALHVNNPPQIMTHDRPPPGATPDPHHKITPLNLHSPRTSSQCSKSVQTVCPITTDPQPLMHTVSCTFK